MWVRLFVRVAAIMMVFVTVLCLANSTLMLKYYEYKERSQMKALASAIDEIDLYSSDATQLLSEIISPAGYSLRITDSFGNTMFSTYDSPVADYKGSLSGNNHDSDGRGEANEGFFKIERNGKRLFGMLSFLSGGERLELTTQQSLLENSARIANEFIFVVSLLCLAAALVWILFSVKRFSNPIREMKDIAENMANLDFSRKLVPSSSDEIGQLAVSINTLSESLDKTLRDLEDKNRRLRDEIEAERRLDKMRKGFVANVSHELKTPIAIISGYAEGIKLSESDGDRQKEYAEIIVEESSRMNEMVLSLLELSRLETGNTPANIQNYNISEQLRGIAERMSTAFSETKAKVLVDLPDELLVSADESKIAQVISNYLSNAASHVISGGEIKIWSEDGGEFYKINVFNSGEKIPKKNMEHIWESFWRGEKSHKRENDRFGLGLSIVKAIISLHGFSCGVYNLDNGVVFWFTVRKAAE